MQEHARYQADEEKHPDIELYGFRLSSQDRLEEIPGKIIATSVKMMRIAKTAGVLNRDYGRLSKHLNKNSRIVAKRAYSQDEEIL